MNTNIPIKMMYKPSSLDKGEEVLVYDFIHLEHAQSDTPDSFMLVWVPRTSSWLTAPVWMFHPILPKKSLIEEAF